MGAARWVVIGTAIAAAATATYMLMGPGPEDPRTSASRTERLRAASPSQAVSEPVGAADARPLDQIDADSREAMRDFLRQSVGEEEEREGKSDW